MILLLDPGDFILDLYSPNKPLNDNVVVNALKSIYDELFITRDDILSLIDEIIFINSSGHIKEITEEAYGSFLKSINKNSQKAKYIFNLLQYPMVENFTTDEIQFMLMGYIQQELKNSEALFIDSLLTNSMIKFLENFSRATGFFKLKKDSPPDWQKIEKVDQYFKIAQALHYKFIGLERISGNYKESQNLQKDIVIKDLMSYKNIRNFNLHAFRFNDDENEELEDFINRLKKMPGRFKYHYCKIDGTNPSRSEERIIIMGIEQLEENDRASLLKRISEDDYDNHLIIIVYKGETDLDDYPKIHLSVDFSNKTTDAIVNISLNIIKQKIEILDEKIDEYREVITKLSYNQTEKKWLLKRLEYYSKGDNIFSSDKVSFWYNLNSLHFMDNKKEIVAEWKKTYKGTDKKTHYKINLDEDNKIWLIEKNGNPLSPINFNRYKAIKYFIYLFKYYSDGKKISFDKLEEVARNWDKTKKEKNFKTSYSTVSDNKRRLLKKYPEFEVIRESLKLSSLESGCYFIKNDKVIIELGDFSIPDAV